MPLALNIGLAEQKHQAASGSLQKAGFRPDIQGLRGVAVLLVVLYHAGLPALPGGYVGVDVFFVISGYLITGLLVKEIERTGGVGLKDFYARRIRRLLPAATLVLFATMATASLVYSPLELKQFVATAFAAALYLSNFWFAHRRTEYLAEDSGADPLLHTWSLGVEEQFYLVWPLLLLVVARSGPPATLRRRLFVAMMAVGALSLAACILLTWHSQPLAFFASPTRAWEFALGGLIALWPAAPRAARAAAGLAGLAGLLAIVAAAVLFTERTAFPGYAALLPVLGAALVVAAGHLAPDMGVGRWLGAGPLRSVGDISYSLYLWHWPVLVFLAPEPAGGDALGPLVGLAISFLLAWLTYVLVENPVRFSRALLGGVHASIALGILLSGLSGSAALALRVASARELESGAQQRYLAARDDLPRIYAKGCHLDFFEVEVEAPECTFGHGTARITVVLFGDSHAAQWFPALERLALREGWRLVSLTKAACPSLPYPVHLEPLGRAYTECEAWRERALARISSLQPEITIVANSNREHAGGDDVGDLRDEDRWLAATRRALGDLEDRSAATVFLRDTRNLPFDAPTCLARADWRGADPARACVVGPPGERSGALFERQFALLSGSDQSLLVDMTDAICPHHPCPLERNGLVLYRDSHHLTATFARRLADPLYEHLEAVVERVRRKAENRKGVADVGAS